MNIKRIFRKIKMKIYRIRDFPESVAIGLAWGTSISFTPLLGFHLIIIYLGTILMRGNLIAATVGSVIGNPWTFPFFFYFSYFYFQCLFLFTSLLTPEWHWFYFASDILISCIFWLTVLICLIRLEVNLNLKLILSPILNHEKCTVSPWQRIIRLGLVK